MSHPDPTRKELEGIIDDALSRLGEHFECIEILASRTEEGCTRCVKRGIGNWYARQGMAQEFIGLTRADEIAERISNQNET